MSKILTTHGIAHAKRGQLKFSTFPDVTLNEAEAFSVLGKSGSGKGMLIKIAAGLIKPTHGTVNIYTAERSYIFLETGLLHNYSAADNLRIALLFSRNNDNAEERIQVSLDKFDLLNVKDVIIDSLPETPKRLLQYARADVLKPKLLFIEEPLKYIRIEQYNLIKMWLKDYVYLTRGACFFTSMYEDYWDFLNPQILNLSGEEVGVVTMIKE
jgi:NitT/TauT family transport system ATP-binding protein